MPGDRRATLTVLALFAAALACGCAGPTVAEREAYASAQTRIASLISDFGEAVRQKDSAAAAALLGPQASPTERVLAGLTARQAVRLHIYTGYKPDAQKAAGELRWSQFRKGRAELSVDVSNADGQKFIDRYTFVLDSGNWELAEVLLQEPVPGAEMDPPADEAERLRAIVKPIMTALQQGAYSRIIVALPPEEEAMYRSAAPSFWGKLFGITPQAHSLYEDLERLREFEVLSWPDVDKELPLALLGPTSVVACYEIPYTWPEGGIAKLDILYVRLFIFGKGDKWRLHRVRLHALGIPDSE